MARKPMPHVPPERFAAARDRARVRNIEVAREMGVSPTRMTELTRTKGGTARQFTRMREAISKLRESRKSSAGTRSSRSSERSPRQSSRRALGQT